MPTGLRPRQGQEPRAGRIGWSGVWTESSWGLARWPAHADLCPPLLSHPGSAFDSLSGMPAGAAPGKSRGEDLGFSGPLLISRVSDPLGIMASSCVHLHSRKSYLQSRARRIGRPAVVFLSLNHCKGPLGVLSCGWAQLQCPHSLKKTRGLVQARRARKLFVLFCGLISHDLRFDGPGWLKGPALQDGCKSEAASGPRFLGLEQRTKTQSYSTATVAAAQHAQL